MTRSDALARLKPLEPALRRQGVTALYLFGSVARDEATAGSDVDLLFDVDRDVKFSLFDQSRIQTELADTLDAGVDLVAAEGLRPAMRTRVDGELVRVF
jgi:predicted nucleotidyltransferase